MLSDLNCYQTYMLEIVQSSDDSPPLLDFQFGSADITSPWQCPGMCIGENADEPRPSNTIFASEFSPISGGGGVCRCVHQVPDNGGRLAESATTMLIRPC